METSWYLLTQVNAVFPGWKTKTKTLNVVVSLMAYIVHNRLIRRERADWIFVWGGLSAILWEFESMPERETLIIRNGRHRRTHGVRGS